MSQKQYRKITTIRLTVTGVLMAMNIALSSLESLFRADVCIYAML